MVDVMKGAQALRMVGKEYMWLGTTQIYSKSGTQTSHLPVGMIGKI